jgi:hypothetical protein
MQSEPVNINDIMESQYGFDYSSDPDWNMAIRKARWNSFDHRKRKRKKDHRLRIHPHRAAYALHEEAASGAGWD